MLKDKKKEKRKNIKKKKRGKKLYTDNNYGIILFSHDFRALYFILVLTEIFLIFVLTQNGPIINFTNVVLNKIK